jgi:hypothetical protein
MPVRRIKICCYEVNLFKTLFLFLVCFLFNFFVDDFCPIFEVTTSTNEAVLLLNFSLPLAKKRFCTGISLQIDFLTSSAIMSKLSLFFYLKVLHKKQQTKGHKDK